MNLSVVVPVYRSEKSLGTLVERLGPVLTDLADDFELILVNDGSPDGSWDVVAALAQEHEWVHGINLMRNFGQHNALLCGVRAAQYEVVVTMDDDLQHPPEEISKLLDEIEGGCDVVFGIPEKREHGMWRNLGSSLTRLALSSAMGADAARNVSAFKAFRTQVRESFAEYRSPFVSLDVLLAWATTRFGVVRVQHTPRLHGSSNYTFGRLLGLALTMMTGYSVLPLRIASIMGFAFTFFGLCVLVYVLGAVFLFGRVAPGFTFLASVIAIFSGAQMFSLGIVGEYLARMHFRMMDRPSYSIREQI
jgi:glycosyltransferase involved in cell wall biosynthesis